MQSDSGVLYLLFTPWLHFIRSYPPAATVRRTPQVQTLSSRTLCVQPRIDWRRARHYAKGKEERLRRRWWRIALTADFRVRRRARLRINNGIPGRRERTTRSSPSATSRALSGVRPRDAYVAARHHHCSSPLPPPAAALTRAISDTVCTYTGALRSRKRTTVRGLYKKGSKY